MLIDYLKAVSSTIFVQNNADLIPKRSVVEPAPELEQETTSPAYILSLSSEAQGQVKSAGAWQSDAEKNPKNNNPEAKEGNDSKTSGVKELSEEEEKAVEKLKKRDSEVRQHEQAHLAAAGPYAKGGVNFEYERGPDSRQYAVGGHVNIDTGEEKEPEQTLEKAQVIKQAAQAPSEPSSQDRAVAAEAAQMEASARQKIQDKQKEKTNPSLQAYQNHAQAYKPAAARVNLVA